MSIQDFETKAAAEVAKAELWFKTNTKSAIALLVAAAIGAILAKIF